MPRVKEKWRRKTGQEKLATGGLKNGYGGGCWERGSLEYAFSSIGERLWGEGRFGEDRRMGW